MNFEFYIIFLNIILLYLFTVSGIIESQRNKPYEEGMTTEKTWNLHFKIPLKLVLQD